MEQQTEELRRCRRCLTRELAGKEETFRSLYEYIANLDSDLKAEEKEYEARLLICKNCDNVPEVRLLCRTAGSAGKEPLPGQALVRKTGIKNKIRRKGKRWTDRNFWKN